MHRSWSDGACVCVCVRVCVYSQQYVMHDRDVNQQSGNQSIAMINMIMFVFFGAKQPVGQR